ncbi:DUF1801 domain-containing protein [Alkalilimnicola ehrlichii]|uniref:DUF1801 domain-containing protein n=1 Tax=Alkalilimnicola ehrlichii TaxID=351052 RepID=UPI0021622887|nr:DUF1801 domain-containing protein [Alkalilimnicola ehrlichii]
MSRIDRLLDDIRATDEARYELVQQLRAIVFELSPQATEEVKYGGLLFCSENPFVAYSPTQSMYRSSCRRGMR